MACQAAELFLAFMESQDMKAQMLDDEKSVVRVGFNMKNTSISIYFKFGDDNSDVHVEGREFVNIPKDQIEKAYRICNKLNSDYRWVKFAWDEDVNDVACRADALIQLDSCAEETYELMVRMAGIVDEAYPDIMKGLWA